MEIIVIVQYENPLVVHLSFHSDIRYPRCIFFDKVVSYDVRRQE